MKKDLAASLIDHTLLAQTAGVREIIRLCQEAKKYKFASVCVNPVYVPVCKTELEYTDIKVCTVIGFPLGAISTQDKISETTQAIAFGADEIDMVINLGAVMDCRFSEAEIDIAEVTEAAHFAGAKIGKKIIVKVILETCYLNDALLDTCCRFVKRAGADFVKTSTGFATPLSSDGKLLPSGASIHCVELMRKIVGPDFGVKASGGIRTTRKAIDMLIAGANRIGSSNGVQIIENWDESIKIPGWDY
ncbi:MAG: deoxyribose-phosphate aldolase [Treponema sp.]|nr:deoxyribose-phosphate aldolase [Treponema sp.]